MTSEVLKNTRYERLARYSRPKDSCRLGKCTEDLKTKLPQGVAEQLRSVARKAGRYPSEYLRNLVISHLEELGVLEELHDDDGMGRPHCGQQ